MTRSGVGERRPARRRHGLVALMMTAGFGALPCVLEAGGPGTRGETLEYDAARGGWVEQVPPASGTAERELWQARQDHADGRDKHAYARIKKWIKSNGDGHPLYPEAALLRAKIEVARRDYYKAHEHLQAFLNEFAGARLEEEAIHYEFVIADVFLEGTRRKLAGLRLLKADDIGIRILDELAASYPESTTAELALKRKADHFFAEGDFSLAEMEYARLREQFPRSRYTRHALRRSADAALAGFPGIEFDDAALIEAEARYKEYLTQYPGIAEQEGVGLILDNIREQRAAKELDIGDYYLRTERPEAAAFYFRSAASHWPETIAARQASNRLANMRRIAGDESAAAAGLSGPPAMGDGP